ncbi:MAG: DNA polymerase II large subunit [Candidatus Thorarchaeota archaeon]
MTESEITLPKQSISYELYFATLNEEIKKIYKIAEMARKKGFDPSTIVEMPPAHDVAGRVEATLDGPVGVAKRIRELQETQSREDVAFAVAKEIAIGELGGIEDPEKAADKAVRVALAILTESITAAPLEGISKVSIRGSGSDRYLALYLAGPIRAAGGTEAAVTVLVADYVRQVLKLPAFVATEDEVERSLEEVELYAREVHLQYPVQPELVRIAASNMPIMLTGEPTEEFEVSAGRDLDRIETNRVRGGSVLVLSDGVVGRATKLAKIVDRVDISGWEWLNELAEKMSKAKAAEVDDSEEQKLAPKSDYLADVIGGRPVFSHPQKIGGFRLRYGRSRNTGLAGVGVHPATMILVDQFLATGTHIRTERPGKGSIVAPVDSIEGPIVLLNDGSIKQVLTSSEARNLEGKVQRIIHLGDILVALGEFLENNHPLVPSGYCEEWWSHDLENALNRLNKNEVEKKLTGSDLTPEELNGFLESPLSNIPTAEQAVYLSTKFGIPLHPRYLYRWLAADVKEVVALREWLLTKSKTEKMSDEVSLTVPNTRKYKSTLEKLGIPHTLYRKGKRIRLSDNPESILAQLGDKNKSGKGNDALKLLNSVTKIELRDKVGFSIGARMGRPEKAEERKMRPPVQVLFPVGRTLGSERVLEKVAKGVQHITSLESFDLDNGDQSSIPTTSSLKLELVARSCPKCGLELFEARCPACGEHTDVQAWCSQDDCGLPIDSNTGMCPRSHDVNLIRFTRNVPVDIKGLLNRVKQEVGEPQTYGLRGVLGLTSDYKIPEYLGKGILRAKHRVYCYRDGTARFDATDAPLTHFTPHEIGVPFWRLRELGYHTDHEGEQLSSDDQILELKVQDLIIPENCADYLVRVGSFVDDCLEKIYNLDRHYNFKLQDDVVGQLVIGLAPHTSAGIIGRIIGFTNASVCYAHPYWHAAKRRNCDGDEDALILVLDALINFSKAYLPRGRGGFMDAPLVLSVILNPNEVDDESHNIEVCSRYPAEFFDMVAEAQHPRAVEHLVDIIASRLETEAQYEGFGFTHGTTSIDDGPRNTKYKTLGSMVEKLDAQLKLATLIDAVDSQDVAERVLSHHFIRDIRGNLRAYATQKIQCLKCHRIYRRVPLSGECSCGYKLSLTVRKKNISKYLPLAHKMIQEHGLGEYLQQRVKLINTSIDSLFVSEQTSLTDFM